MIQNQSTFCTHCHYCCHGSSHSFLLSVAALSQPLAHQLIFPRNQLTSPGTVVSRQLSLQTPVFQLVSVTSTPSCTSSEPFQYPQAIPLSPSLSLSPAASHYEQKPALHQKGSFRLDSADENQEAPDQNHFGPRLHETFPSLQDSGYSNSVVLSEVVS